MRRSNQIGSSMIEALGVLSIVAILAVSSIKMIGGLFSQYKISSTASQIKELQKNITSRYDVWGEYNTFDIDDLISEKVIPSDMIVDKNKIVHNFGGKVEIKKFPRNNLYYSIIFNDVPYESCVELATVNWIINQGSNLKTFSINKYEFFWPCKGPYCIDDGVRIGTSPPKGDEEEKEDGTPSEGDANFLFGISEKSKNALPAKIKTIITKCKDDNKNTIEWLFQ